MKPVFTVLAALFLLPAPALAQEANPAAAGACSERIRQVADRIPDLSETKAPAETVGVSEEKLQAALAALDAARLADKAGAAGGCSTMVDAAEAMLTEGGYAEGAE